MSHNHKRRTHFSALYWSYLIASVLTMLIFLILMFFCYCTSFQEQVTLSDLFLNAVLLLLTMYLRINASHYQNLTLQLDVAEKRRPSMKFDEQRRPVRNRRLVDER